MVAKKRISLLVVLLMGAWCSVHGQTVKSDRPDVYTVRTGDTLWDISERFLNEPWLWPELWQANRQINNPHLIYPGDRVSLAFEAGKPRLRLTRGPRPIIKLSPSVRVSPSARAEIPAIPVDAISQFLSRPRVVPEGFLESAPYVVSIGKEHLVAGAGFRIYVRGIEGGSARNYGIFREGSAYIDPKSGEVLGYEALHLGDAVLENHGDPATLKLIQTKREILAGDRLLPVDETLAVKSFLPVVPSGDVKGSIIGVVEGVTQIGQYQVVVLNVGETNGLRQGHVLSVWQKGQEVEDKLYRDPKADFPVPEVLIELDPKRQGGIDGLTMAMDRVLRDIQREVGALFGDEGEFITLPEERAGTVMVFRAFERLSYALVMDAVRPMHVLDSVRNP